MANHKFTRISNELYKAIMQTDFSKRQRKIIDLVIRMSYGCQKEFAILRPSDFEVVGVYRTHIKKELEYLVSANVLLIDGERIAINKNYDQWRVSLVKSVDHEKFQDILKRNLSSEPVTESVTEVTETVTGATNDRITKTVTEVTEMVTNNDEEVTKIVTDDYQNSNSGVTKTVTSTPQKFLNDRASELSKDNIKDNIKTNNSSGGDIIDPRVGRLFQSFHNHFITNHAQDQKLSGYLDDGMEPELLEKAIQITRENGKDITYLWGILNRMLERGITTLSLYEQHEQEWRERKRRCDANGKGEKVSTQRQKQLRKDKVPEWVAKQESNLQTVATESEDVAAKRQKIKHLLQQLGEWEEETG